MKYARLTSFSLGYLFFSLFSFAANAAECDTRYYGTELVDDVTWCASSVLAPQGRNQYRPGNLEGWEESLSSAWCEGVVGPGYGEWFEVKIRPAQRLETLTLFNGYQKSRRAFLDNTRVRQVRIWTDNGVDMIVRLHDHMGRQRIALPGQEDLSQIRVEIQDVYRGQKYDDLCISAIGLDFEEGRYLE